MFRNLLIATAIFGLGWGASFGAGVAYARRSTPAVQAAQIAGQNGTSAQAQGGTAALGQTGGQGARGTVGIVSAAAGNTLTVTGANNQTAKVSVTDQTRILKEAAGTLQDLPAGTRIAVQPQGQPAADGTITAATIQVVPEGAAAPAGGQAQRQQGQQGGSQTQGSGQQRQQQQGAG